RDWQPVRLFENEHWKALVTTLLEELVPDITATGTLVTVQGADIVLHRDAAGQLHGSRLENKPAALQIGRRISEEAFAARANAYLQAELARDNGIAGPVLFAVGEDELGGAFVLFDFERRQSVFIAQPPSA